MAEFSKKCLTRYQMIIMSCCIILCWGIIQRFLYGNIHIIRMDNAQHDDVPKSYDKRDNKSSELIVEYIHTESESSWKGSKGWFDYRAYLPSLNELFSNQMLVQKHNTLMGDIKLFYRDFGIIQSKSESCFVNITRKRHQCGVHCAGIGANVIWGSDCISENLKRGISIYMNESNCDWGKHDLTKECDTYFNCYLLGEIKWEPKKYDHTICSTNTTWFAVKYGDLMHYAVILTYIWNGYTLYDNHGIFKLDKNDCICVHIRRGDSCYHPLRQCWNFTDYIDGAIQMRKLYNINNIKLLTDAYDVDVIINLFKKHNFNIIYTNDKLNRTNLNTQEIPENRKNELGTAPIKEYFDDINNGMECKLFIGTFSSSMTKILFSLMIIKHQYIPPYYSPDGCAGDSSNVGRNGPCKITNNVNDNLWFF